MKPNRAAPGSNLVCRFELSASSIGSTEGKATTRHTSMHGQKAFYRRKNSSGLFSTAFSFASCDQQHLPAISNSF
jgi:hypothetical protein